MSLVSAHRARRPRAARIAVRAGLALAAFVPACAGGGDGGTAPPAVASVVITAPGGPITFQTLTRTAQFGAVARDAAQATVTATIAWQSSNPGVATVNGAGLVTAVGNGTTQVTASAGGITSTAVAVTVAQVAAQVTPTPAAVAFGALGAGRQLAASVVDSSGAPVAGAPAVAWTRAGTGATASVSAGGFATALAVGATDTAVATAAGRVARIPISVTQVPRFVTVGSTGSDTLRTSTRTKAYTATVEDSLNNPIAGLAATWSSSSPATASIDAGTGVATALNDGVTTITATVAPASGQRALRVQRYAATFTLTPPAATITTPLGTQLFLGTAEDSVASVLPIIWTSRTTSVATLSAASGTQVTATAAGNGTSYVVMQAGTRADSSLVTVSGQAVAPNAITVFVSDFAFTSQRNNTSNQAIDTVAVGGTVTWQWEAGTVTHNVTSTGSPNFASSTNRSSGSYAFLFANAGTYQYICSIHPAMTGRVVVR